MKKTTLEIVKEAIKEGKTFGQVLDEMKQFETIEEAETEYAGEVSWSAFAEQHVSCYSTLSGALTALFQSYEDNDFNSDDVIDGSEEVTAGINDGFYTIIWGIGTGAGGYTTLADSLNIDDWYADFING